MDLAAIRKDEALGATRRLARLASSLAYGDLDAPTRHAALGAKYLDLATPVLGAGRAQATLEMPWRLDELAEVTGLCDELAEVTGLCDALAGEPPAISMGQYQRPLV